eukprot:304766-Prorocentrum_minimum.AAC.1
MLLKAPPSGSAERGDTVPHYFFVGKLAILGTHVAHLDGSCEMCRNDPLELPAGDGIHPLHRLTSRAEPIRGWGSEGGCRGVSAGSRERPQWAPRWVTSSPVFGLGLSGLGFWD